MGNYEIFLCILAHGTMCILQASRRTIFRQKCGNTICKSLIKAILKNGKKHFLAEHPLIFQWHRGRSREGTEKLFLPGFFSKTFDHLQYTATRRLGRSRMHIQEGDVLAAAGHSSPWEPLYDLCLEHTVLWKEIWVRHSSGLHLCPQQGRVETAFTAKNMPEQCWGALLPAFYAFSLPGYGQESKPTSTFLIGVFSLIWKLS